MNTCVRLAPIGLAVLMVCCREQIRQSCGLGPSDKLFDVVEVWEPACMMARPELAGIGDPDELERQAVLWLEANEARIAAEIAASHDAKLMSWHHDPDYADNTPFGATVVVLRPRR